MCRVEKCIAGHAFCDNLYILIKIHFRQFVAIPNMAMALSLRRTTQIKGFDSFCKYNYPRENPHGPKTFPDLPHKKQTQKGIKHYVFIEVLTFIRITWLLNYIIFVTL